ncbi:Iron-regulated ABC transporter ATPase subunit SufC [Fontimonas thermophila]|uniref:Iron-regulated ABC transporter ATPase subunit SufC n=1 Tax=Fontimonas thermophila TaxID=1076937 RepID=A0A1I2ITQ8_9GAMM|nr:Fe-S cluster assembly ATPase SufC [Fontimonas thermophila]SFF45003.1 Iron-regulated ABC transporter ATPase subunit SufC [Fontimonas thermophila]
MLEIENLHARAGDTAILKGLNLTVNAGEVHAVMGPNGSGKSTLSKIIAGSEDYIVTDGRIRFEGRDLLTLPPEERAAAGIFLGFQYPVEIPGVSNMVFLRAAVNAQRKHRGEPELEAADFLAWVRHRVKQMKMDPAMLSRGVNEGFSGGEKKRNEILQMLVLEPKLMVLDETDSGLDIDALKIVAEGINALRSPARATLLVTHYQRLLDHVQPDHVHVLSGGRIVKSGGPDLARELEEKGYGWLDAA